MFTFTLKEVDTVAPDSEVVVKETGYVPPGVVDNGTIEIVTEFPVCKNVTKFGKVVAVTIALFGMFP